MSLQHAAQHLSSQGRHGDDMLVHMSKDEVKGLQALAKAHGGSLTINPHTGLAEAGFLRNILPAVASAAAVATGNPELVPYITAGSAAEAYSRTGSLAQGALAGYSAYSGGQLAAGMGAAGTPEYVPPTSPTDVANQVGSKATSLLPEAQPQLLEPQLTPEVTPNVTPNVTQPPAGTPPSGTPEFEPRPAYTPPSNVELLKNNLLANPSAGLGVAAAGAGILDPNVKTGAGKTPEDARNPHYLYHSAYNAETGKNDPNKKQYYENLGYYADGGITAAYAAGGSADADSIKKLQEMQAAQTQQAQGTTMATGGLSDLGGYSDGGRLLKGPGDGVSDSIPAVIGHKQPARLADGEFVVPARIVSEIGNGSTEAGARKLYAMMDRVQSARGKTVGKGKVAKNTKADKYLPA